MIEDNKLSDYLNNYKNKDSKSDKEQSLPSLKNPTIDLFSSIITLIAVITKSIIFGYSTKIIFSVDWNFLSTICIGLAITLIINYIYDMFHGKK